MENNKKGPLVIEYDVVVPTDVDKTIIDYCITGKPKESLIQVGLIPGKEIWVYPIKEHIEMIKNMKAANAFIIAKSGSGYKWAAHIIEKVGLSDYVDLIATKEKWYLDDIPYDEFCKRLYVYPPYKK